MITLHLNFGILLLVIQTLQCTIQLKLLSLAHLPNDSSLSSVNLPDMNMFMTLINENTCSDTLLQGKLKYKNQFTNDCFIHFIWLLTYINE